MPGNRAKSASTSAISPGEPQGEVAPEVRALTRGGCGPLDRLDSPMVRVPPAGWTNRFCLTGVFPAAAGKIRRRMSGSGITRAQRRRDVLDRLFLRRAYLLPFLPVGRSDLVGHGEHEAPVVIALLDGRLVFQQRRHVAQTVDPLIPELLGIVNFPALHARLLRHDLVERPTLP